MDKKTKENFGRRDVYGPIIVSVIDGTFKLDNVGGSGIHNAITDEDKNPEVVVLIGSFPAEVFMGYLELLPGKKFALWKKPIGTKGNNTTVIRPISDIAAWDTFENAVKDWGKRYI